MHRQTPLTIGFVGYSGGGARTLIDEIDDSKLMQQMKGSIMGESREKVESPQNYGFSSVVRPATKGKDGKIQDAAEGFMSYFGGNRSSNFCAVMDDRRYRPMGLKPGENAQYDDLGQMTLLRRTGVYLLTNDNEEENSQQSGGGASAGQHADSGGQQKPERYVSLRHVEKKKQDRPKRGSGAQSGGGGSGGSGGAGAGTLDSSSGGGSGQSAQDYKHEGETVNNEVRVTKKDIQILDGETVVGRYDKQSGTWTFTSKNITLTASDHLTIECTGGATDIKGKPINFNGGGPSTTPFTVPG